MRWVIKYAEQLNLKLQGFCIDRGFCSKEIADYIKQADYGFVMMLTDNIDSYTDAVAEIGGDIRNNVENSGMILVYASRRKKERLING